MEISPYTNIPQDKWSAVTKELIEEHPLKPKQLVETCLTSWNLILTAHIGKDYQIGKNIFPKPQIMGFFLHELIPSEIQNAYPKIWKKEESANDKDLVCLSNDKYSIEIKTSSNAKNIFGNRSYSQVGESNKKSKSGYYLTINFEKFEEGSSNSPRILLIRFGWLDHTDWIGQTAATGQQARLNPSVTLNKLITIYQLP